MPSFDKCVGPCKDTGFKLHDLYENNGAGGSWNGISGVEVKIPNAKCIMSSLIFQRIEAYTGWSTLKK